MNNLPEIADLPLVPLKIPGGWRVEINLLYQLDPDDNLAGRKLLHIDPDSITDPWGDVLHYYFDHSWLWLAVRDDQCFTLSVEWVPIGRRDGRFIIQQFRGEPMRFAQTPPQSLKRNHDGIQLRYALVSPIISSDRPERTFETRCIEEVASTLNQWLPECA
jgi:hypothetical protein